MSDFGPALVALKVGRLVQRSGWNGKGMWLQFVEAGNYTVGMPAPTLPWIGMKTADDKFVPWIASQTDLLAEDWEIISAASVVSDPGGKTLKVSGYTPQPDAKVALVNSFKEMEERLYRAIEKSERDQRAYLSYGNEGLPNADSRDPVHGYHIAGRAPLVGEAVQNFMIGFMLLNRAIFQPQRIKLPEDGE